MFVVFWRTVLVNELDIIQDIVRVAARLGIQMGEPLSRSEYYNNGAKFSHYGIYDSGKSWSYYCQKAGFKDKAKSPISDDVYFERLVNAVNKLGRLPKTSERKEYNLNFKKSRWPTLDSFILEAIKKGVIEDIDGRYERINTAKDTIKVTEFTSSIQNYKSNIKIPSIPEQTKRKKWERINISCFPYAPQDEQGVVAIFCILCHNKILPFILIDLNGGKGIDADCYNIKTESYVKVEFKHTLRESSFNHDLNICDIIICWINKWKDIGKEIIELSEVLKNCSVL